MNAKKLCIKKYVIYFKRDVWGMSVFFSGEYLRVCKRIPVFNVASYMTAQGDMFCF